jgi:hypothetical protein
LRNIFRCLVLLAAGACGVWLWTALFPSPEKIITRQFEKLARAASVQPGAGYLPRMAGAQTVGGFFSTNVDVNIDTLGFQQHAAMSRDDIVQAMMAAHLSGGLTVKFPDINVTVDPDQQSAQADITVEAQAPGEQDMTVQEMRFTLRKLDGKWLITRVQTVRTLS